MEYVNEIELIAYENSIIAKKEIAFANELKKMAKIEYQNSKARKKLVQKKIEIAKIREKLA